MFWSFYVSSSHSLIENSALCCQISAHFLSHVPGDHISCSTTSFGKSSSFQISQVPIECKKDGIDYNLISDVYLGKPGYDLAESLGISTEEDVLYAVFVKGAGHERNAETQQSALCVYSLKQIELKFLENIELCFRGESYKVRFLRFEMVLSGGSVELPKAKPLICVLFLRLPNSD